MARSIDSSGRGTLGNRGIASVERGKTTRHLLFLRQRQVGASAFLFSLLNRTEEQTLLTCARGLSARKNERKAGHVEGVDRGPSESEADAAYRYRESLIFTRWRTRVQLHTMRPMKRKKSNTCPRARLLLCTNNNPAASRARKGDDFLEKNTHRTHFSFARSQICIHIRCRWTRSSIRIVEAASKNIYEASRLAADEWPLSGLYSS